MAPAAMNELVESIKSRGILQPILARRHPKTAGRYQIIAGERRWRAAQTAGLHEVPVLVRELSDQDAMAASLVENLQRQDLNPIEEAEGFTRLIEEFGLTQEQLGAAVGKSRSHIANTIRLLQLPDSVRTEVQAGTLSAGHARALLAHANPEEAARQVIANGLNVRQTEALATNRVRPSGTAADKMLLNAIFQKNSACGCRSRSTAAVAAFAFSIARWINSTDSSQPCRGKKVAGIRAGSVLSGVLTRRQPRARAAACRARPARNRRTNSSGRLPVSLHAISTWRASSSALARPSTGQSARLAENPATAL